MKKFFLIIFLTNCIFWDMVGQEIIEINSFTYHLSYDDAVWYVIEPCFKYDNNEIICRKDSILCLDPKLNEIFPFKYKVLNEWYIGERCYKYKNLEKCYIDSVLIYTPIKYFLNKNKPGKDDTLAVLDYSKMLFELGETKIFETNLKYDILRFTWLYQDKVVVYRLEMKQSITTIYYKCGSLNGDKIQLVRETSQNLNLKKYNKLLSCLKKGKYWEISEDFTFLPRNIIIESFVNGKYYFINKNNEEIRLKNKGLLKSFVLLERFINENKSK